MKRRDLLQSLAGAAALGTLGSRAAVLRQARAAEVYGDRKFLFFFASGGWDPTPLDPKFAADGVSPLTGTDMDPGTVLARAGNLTWSGGPDREGMTRFFQRWGGRAALVRGVDVHSAGHESGMSWTMTGTSASSMPDWAAILASRGTVDYPMPHVVFSGPAYPGSFGAAVIRGGGGTLLDLIDADIVGQADAPAPVAPPPMDRMMDAALYGRAGRFATAAGPGTRAEALLGTLDRAMELEGRRFEAVLGDTGSSLLDQASMSIELMRLGMCRSAMIGIPGGWDTHGGNQDVGPQLDSFFTDLDSLLDSLANTPGTLTDWLIDEVVVVCLSELGRTPLFNGSMGRDHWPYTSALVLGSGVRGNQVLGRTDDGFLALPINLGTGAADNNGSLIGAENLGTALLKLGGLDPELYLPGVAPLDGLLA